MAEFNLQQLREEEAKRYKASDLETIKPIVPFLREHVSPVINQIMTDYVIQPEEMARERLIEIRTKQDPCSRALACAIYTGYYTGRLFQQAQDYLDQGNRGYFYTWYTLANNVQDISLCIHRAEGVLRRGARAEVIYAFNGEVPKNAEAVAQRFERYNEILTMDPTGISLMEYQVRRATQDMFDFPNPQKDPYIEFYHPIRVLAAVYAAEVYRNIYPLS